MLVATFVATIFIPTFFVLLTRDKTGGAPATSEPGKETHR
jgi:hypothetical protein